MGLTSGVGAGVLRRVEHGARGREFAGGLGGLVAPAERHQSGDYGGAGNAYAKDAQEAAAGGSIVGVLDLLGHVSISPNYYWRARKRTNRPVVCQ